MPDNDGLHIAVRDVLDKTWAFNVEYVNGLSNSAATDSDEYRAWLVGMTEKMGPVMDAIEDARAEARG